MNHRLFRLLIAGVLVLFVLVTLTFQNICVPDKNPVSAAESNYVDKNMAQPQPDKPIDPLSYDAVIRIFMQWAVKYCKR